MQSLNVSLYRLNDPLRLLPSDGSTVYECTPDKEDPFGIRVKFLPTVHAPPRVWKVHVSIDGLSIGYCNVVSKPSHDGFWRVRFEGIRANQDCSLKTQMLFQEAIADGDGECGVIDVTLEEGHYDARFKRSRDNDDHEPASKRLAGENRGHSSSSSTSVASGDVCTGRGKEFVSTAFRSERGTWVSEVFHPTKRIRYCDEPRPQRKP